MRRRAVAVVLALAACGSSSNEPAPVALEDFPAAFAARYCRRAYDCCLPDDRAAAAPGTDEASCAAMMTEFARSNAELLLGFHGVAYFAPAARRCLELLDVGACGEIFEPHQAALVGCQDVFAGTFALGTPCEDAQQCASAVCSDGACAVAATCADPDVVAATTCVPRVGLGEPCYVSPQCPAGAACDQGACRREGALGEGCSLPSDCAGTCAPDATGASVCRAGLCRGA